MYSVILSRFLLKAVCQSLKNSEFWTFTSTYGYNHTRYLLPQQQHTEYLVGMVMQSYLSLLHSVLSYRPSSLFLDNHNEYTYSCTCDQVVWYFFFFQTVCRQVDSVSHDTCEWFQNSNMPSMPGAFEFFISATASLNSSLLSSASGSADSVRFLKSSRHSLSKSVCVILSINAYKIILARLNRWYRRKADKASRSLSKWPTDMYVPYIWYLICM